MYAAFLEAHQKAVELTGLTPELRGDRAQGLHLFELKFEEAECELLQAREENPRTAGVYIRLAVLYATMKRFDEAMEALRHAYAVDGLWPILPAAEILTRCCRGELEAAVACGKKAIDLHPYLALGRAHYAQALDLAGRFDEALLEYRLACVMSPDLARLRAEEGRCLARHGRRTEAAAILAELDDLRRTEYVDAYFMAFLLDGLGRTEDAFAELERAGAENSTNLFLMDVDPRMDGLRSHSRFGRLRNRFFRSVPAQRVSDFVISTYTAKDSTQRHRVAS
jgi:tetratricopeptide (TPR) repeat protein